MADQIKTPGGVTKAATAPSDVVPIIAVMPLMPPAIVAGVQIATTGAVALPAIDLFNGVVLKAAIGNSGVIYVGPAGVTMATGYPLNPGDAISYAVANLSAIYMIGVNTTDTIAYTGN
jgi:hypothetical protein